MIDLSRFGDTNHHGGNVICDSTMIRFRSRFVARKSGEVICPRHDVKPNLIIEGDKTMTDEGVPVARHGCRTTCGCCLISRLL
jgi:uncharacterized Zn-binding protein involved in type VI secretion